MGLVFLIGLPYDRRMYLAPTPYVTGTLAQAPSGRAQSFHTLKLMRDCVRAARTDPRIIQAAVGVVYLTPERDAHAEASALFKYVRDYIRYIADVFEVETLCDPVMTLQRMVGDCDDKTTLLCALFESVGFPTRFVMAGYNGSDFEHVYCQVLLNDFWTNCDPTEKGELGYAPPLHTALYIEKV